MPIATGTSLNRQLSDGNADGTTLGQSLTDTTTLNGTLALSAGSAINLGASGIIYPTPVAFFPSAIANTTGTTISAAQILGGLITRTGPTAAFTDTLSSAALIFAGNGIFYPVGTSEGLFYTNSTAFTATLTAGVGVTMSNITVPPFGTVYMQLALTSATTAIVSLVGTFGAFQVLPNVLVGTADNGTNQTLTTAMVTGGVLTTHLTTGGATPSLTMPLATAIIAAIPGFGVTDSYVLRVINSNSGTATIVTNTGITTTGTLTLATNTTRDFAITMTGAATVSMVSIGTGTNS